MAIDKKQLLKILEDTKDEANLSDEDLAKRVDAYNQLSTLPRESRQQVSKANLAQSIFDEISKRNYGTDVGRREAAKYAADTLVDGNYSDQTFAEIILNKGGTGNKTFNQTKELGRWVHNAYKPVVNNYLETIQDPAVDYSGDIKRIGDIQKDRKFVSDEEAKVAALEEEIPKLLEEQNAAFFGDQRNAARDYVTGNYAHQVVQQLNRRGLADSGQFGVSLADKQNEIESVIEQQEIQKRTDDFNFWADKAYQATFDKLIQARTGVAAQVENTRQDALKSSSQNFQKAQNEIQSRFNLDLFRSENERALANYRTQQQARSKEKSDQEQAQTISSIGNLVGTGVTLAALG